MVNTLVVMENISNLPGEKLFPQPILLYIFGEFLIFTEFGGLELRDARMNHACTRRGASIL